MTRPVLREYQVDAIGKVFKRFAEGDRRTAGVAATGAGKTVILSELIRRYQEDVDPRPALMLAHRSELLTQAADKMRAAMPGKRIGFIQAGKNHTSAPVIVGSVQTLAPRDTASSRRRWASLPDFGLIVVDECHRSVSPAYLKTLEGLGCLRPDGPRTVGFTATFTREDKARLTDFWQSVAFSVDILDLIDWGFLVPPKFQRVLVEGLDLSHLSLTRRDGVTDLSSTELAEAMDQSGAAGVVAAAYRRHASDRQGIVFTPSVASAETVAQALRDVGITSAALSGSTPAAQRRKILDDYQAGRLQTVVNCAILGEGFDAPATSCVVIARPTLSKILFRQQVGRGLRPGGGHPDCLVLDMVGATGRNNLATLDDVTGVPSLHVEEGETVTEARDRVARQRAEVIGDAGISGSLDSVAVDPWEAERRSKLTRREREAEDALEEGEEPEEETGPPPPKLRYAPVGHREGWFLRSQRGRWFIPMTAGTERKRQNGVVLVLPVPGGSWDVVAAFHGAGAHYAGSFGDRETAARTAVTLCLELVTSGVDRGLSDPDAAWRRRRSGQKARDLAMECGADEDAVVYAGQASDWIALRTHGRLADALQIGR